MNKTVMTWAALVGVSFPAMGLFFRLVGFIDAEKFTSFLWFSGFMVLVLVIFAFTARDMGGRA